MSSGVERAHPQAEGTIARDERRDVDTEFVRDGQTILAEADELLAAGPHHARHGGQDHGP